MGRNGRTGVSACHAGGTGGLAGQVSVVVFLFEGDVATCTAIMKIVATAAILHFCLCATGEFCFF